MNKGQQTREHILHQAADIFSLRGYFGTSMADLVRATGIEKGGIYNHFSSKDQLAEEAFDYAYGLTRQRILATMQTADTPLDQLQGFLTAFASQVFNPSVPGGCPVLNTAIEADDAHPGLRERAYNAATEWLNLIITTVEEGQQRGEIRAEIDPTAVATLLVTTLEGTIMLCKLLRSRSPMEQTVAHLRSYLEHEVRQTK